ncbi:hypothetical protein DFS34DRAFT_596368 [Phlyctochytrium arcticum]|nr:hypothetical protein DFS34DRAFT_596368 [Phlyctochytrium arcticum]
MTMTSPPGVPVRKPSVTSSSSSQNAHTNERGTGSRRNSSGGNTSNSNIVCSIENRDVSGSIDVASGGRTYENYGNSFALASSPPYHTPTAPSSSTTTSTAFSPSINLLQCTPTGNLSGSSSTIYRSASSSPAPTVSISSINGAGMTRSTSFKAALNDPQLAKSMHESPAKRSSSYKDPQNAASKFKFESAVRRYYYQLTVGCGDSTCTHKLCASSILSPKLNPDASAIMAVQLASRPRLLFCPRIPPTPPSGFSNAHPTPDTGQSHALSPSSRTSPFSKVSRSSPSPSNTSVNSVPARPFLSSLLAASPFSSLFPSEAPSIPTIPTPLSDGSSTFAMRRSHSASDLDDVHLSEDLAKDIRDDQHEQETPPNSTTIKTLDTEVGLKLVSKFGTDRVKEHSQFFSKSKSSADLPTLSAVTGTMFHRFSQRQRHNTSSASSTPRTTMSRSTSHSSISSMEPEQLKNALLHHQSQNPPDVDHSSGRAPLYLIDTSTKLKQSLSSSDTSATAPTTASPTTENPHLSLGYLTLPLLKSAVATYHEAVTPTSAGVSCQGMAESDALLGDPRFLVNSIETVFSDPEALNRSFLRTGNTAESPHSSQLDLPAVREAYAIILKLSPRKTFLTPFINSFELILARLSLNTTTLHTSSSSSLRHLLILLENPLLLDFTYHDSLLKHMCLLLGNLKSKPRHVLTQWLSEYEPAHLKSIVQVFQSFLADHFHPHPQPDQALVCSIKVLSLLYRANDLGSRHKPGLDISVFYNDVLDRKLNFKEEYKQWRRTLEDTPSSSSNKQSVRAAGKSTIKSTTPSSSIHKFSYFNYPFLFTPLAKTRIMHIDAMVQMSLEFEDAFVHQALVVHAQRFLTSDSRSVHHLEHALKQATNPYLVLEIRRDRLVEDVLDQLRTKHADLKKPLKVRFVGGGEEGMDQGGVQKEFFQVLVAKLLDPAYGMFTYDTETRLSWIQTATLESEGKFELVGRVLGLALYNGVIVDVPFPNVVYKKLLGEHVDLEDVKEAWPALGQGLKTLLTWPESQGDVRDIFYRTFEISYDLYGTVKTYPLVENGEDLFVTSGNRQEFVNLYIQHWTGESVKRQFDALRRGFQGVCGGLALKMCRSTELKHLLIGTTPTTVSFQALEKAACYDDGYSESHPVIEWFWSIVHDQFDICTKRKLLEFVTASDRVPVGGWGGVTFVIQRNGPDTDRLPTALTCFGRLLLPEYASREKLHDRLLTAIENAKGFGLV